MTEEELRKLAEKELSAYLKSHPNADSKDTYVDGFLAGAKKTAWYIAHAIKFMAENNPEL